MLPGHLVMNRPNGQQCLAKTIIDPTRNVYSNETALVRNLP